MDGVLRRPGHGILNRTDCPARQGWCGLRQAGDLSTTTSRRALTVFLSVSIVGATVLVGCSSSTKRAAHQTATTAHRRSTQATAPRTTTTAPLKTYQVKRGDRLSSIANRFHVSVAAIVFVNRIADPDRLTDGQVLKIPTAAPLALVVTPAKAPSGQTFELNLIGSKPREVIKFEIDSPSGKHTGPPHIASTDGSVATRYQTSAVNPIGTYKVVASGNKGTKTRATFQIIKRG